MKPEVRLGYVILYVENVPDSIAFYKKAFGLEVRFLHESGQYAEMETGQTSLAFANEEFVKESHQFRVNRRGQEPAGVEIALIVEDVETAFDHALGAGAAQVAKPAQKPWGMNGFRRFSHRAFHQESRLL